MKRFRLFIRHASTGARISLWREVRAPTWEYEEIEAFCEFVAARTCRDEDIQYWQGEFYRIVEADGGSVVGARMD